MPQAAALVHERLTGTVPHHLATESCGNAATGMTMAAVEGPLHL